MHQATNQSNFLTLIEAQLQIIIQLHHYYSFIIHTVMKNKYQISTINIQILLIV